jgi:hypothetical protein
MPEIGGSGNLSGTIKIMFNGMMVVLLLSAAHHLSLVLLAQWDELVVVFFQGSRERLAVVKIARFLSWVVISYI